MKNKLNTNMCRLEDSNLLVPTLFDSPMNGMCLIPLRFTRCPQKARQLHHYTHVP